MTINQKRSEALAYIHRLKEAGATVTRADERELVCGRVWETYNHTITTPDHRVVVIVIQNRVAERLGTRSAMAIFAVVNGKVHRSDWLRAVRIYLGDF
jgi:hypothetical protein